MSETVEVERRTLAILARHANSADDPRGKSFVHEAVQNAFDALDDDSPVELDYGDQVEQRFDSVSVTLDTGREVTTHADFDADGVTGAWGEGRCLSLTIEDDWLEETLAEAVDE